MRVKLNLKSGWDAVTLNSHQENIDEVLNRGEVTARYADVYFVDYKSKGMVVSYRTNSKTANAFFFYNKDEGYEKFKALDLETEEGITWQSTREDILKVFGPPKQEATFTKGPISGSRIVYTDFDFRVINSVLKRISIWSN